MKRSPYDKTHQVKIDYEVVHFAKMIAESQGITLGEYISEIVRKDIAIEWPKVMEAARKQLDIGLAELEKRKSK